MIGFCLAAGAGSRLAPLTRVTPKPLLAPAGRPLVDLAVDALQLAGATRVVVNAHHGADPLIAHLTGRPGVEVVVEPVLLGTGGGLVNAASLGLLGDGDDPVLVTAADHVVDPTDLAALAAFLDQSGAPMAAGLVQATTNPFALRLEAPAPGPGSGQQTSTDRLLPTRGSAAPGRGSVRPSGKGAARSSLASGRGSPLPVGEGVADGGGWVVRDPEGPWDSAGVYVVRAGLLLDLEPGTATLVHRVLGPLLDLGQLAGLPFRGPTADAGTLDRLLDVSAGLLTGRWPYELPPGRVLRGVGSGPVFVADGAVADPAAVLAGPVVLDAGSRVGAGAVVTRSVVGPGAEVGSGARVVGSFLGPRAQLPPGETAIAALVPGPQGPNQDPTRTQPRPTPESLASVPSPPRAQG
jgi:NDP-sugar pyrophosphorylase family protein